MPLPKKISPNPIVTSTIELRINSTLSTHQIFSQVLPKVQTTLPNITTTNLDKIFKTAIVDSQLKYIPDYVLSNNEYSLSISENVISLSNVNEYMLWVNYYPFIKDILKSLFSLNYIKIIDRIGVRYASLFNNVLNVEEILNFVPNLRIDGYEEKFNHFRGDFKIREYNLHLQLLSNARAKKNNKVLTGAVIDIDASYTKSLEPTDKIITIIDELHTEEKILFFKKLIKPEFLKTLNPEY